MKTLLISDNQQVVRDIIFCLHLRWPHAIIFSSNNGSNGMRLLEANLPDLLLTDYSLPDMNIQDFVMKVRDFSDIPLIILIDAQSDVDKAKVLEAGADDYISKPFSPVDIMAKVRALLRRTYAVSFQQNDVPLVKGELTINISTHQVFLSGTQVKLTNREYQMLLQLVRNEGRIVTHRSFLEHLWGDDYVVDCEFTKKYIYRLRQKLHDNANNPRMILTERGVGYRFVRPV